MSFSRFIALTLSTRSLLLDGATANELKKDSQVVNLAPVAELEVELSMFAPWWPDSSSWVTVWPHQTVSAAAQFFCESHGNWNEACAPNLAKHLVPLLLFDHDLCATRALQYASQNRSITGQLSYDEVYAEGSADSAADAAGADSVAETAAYIAARIALIHNPDAVLKLPALMAIATALQLHLSPRLLVF